MVTVNTLVNVTGQLSAGDVISVNYRNLNNRDTLINDTIKYAKYYKVTSPHLLNNSLALASHNGRLADNFFNNFSSLLITGRW